MTAPEHPKNRDFDRVRLTVDDDVELPNGDFIGSAVDRHGELSFWILRGHRDDTQPQGKDTAEHEQLGRLPDEWRTRVARLTTLRCGAPTQQGRPCRVEVGKPGPCARHRAAIDALAQARAEGAAAVTALIAKWLAENDPASRTPDDLLAAIHQAEREVSGEVNHG